MSQIFKNNVPNLLLYDLLNKICQRPKGSLAAETNYYLYNNVSFKKGVYNHYITQFITDITPYYHISKRKKYLERTQTNISFATILRQICNANSIRYSTELKYDKSSYDIEYYIYC